MRLVRVMPRVPDSMTQCKIFHRTIAQHYLSCVSTGPQCPPPTLLWRHWCKVQSARTITGRLHQWATCSWHAYSYIQQSGRRLKLWMPKIRKKSPIHENADANITCNFSDGDISRSRSLLPHTRTHGHTHIVSSIIVRLQNNVNLLKSPSKFLM